MNLITARNIEVRESPVHGWGVFAIEDIPKNTVIEESPVVETNIKGKDNRIAILDRYCWGDPDIGYVFTMGLGAVFNTKSNDADVLMEWYLKKRFFRYTTIKNVKKDQELFIDYRHWIKR